MRWVNLIIVGCLYIGLPMVWGMLRSASRERNNLVLSVTLPPQARQDPEVQDICARFRRRLDRMCLLLTAVLVPALFLPWMSLACLYSFVWLLLLVLPYWLFGQGNRELKELKRRRGWQVAGAGQTVAEMPPAKPPRQLPRAWFWPPLVLSVQKSTTVPTPKIRWPRVWLERMSIMRYRSSSSVSTFKKPRLQ